MGPADSEPRHLPRPSDYRGCGTGPHTAAARMLAQGGRVAGFMHGQGLVVGAELEPNPPATHFFAGARWWVGG